MTSLCGDGDLDSVVKEKKKKKEIKVESFSSLKNKKTTTGKRLREIGQSRHDNFTAVLIAAFFFGGVRV